MKNDRQKMILEIISQEPVETQEQLLSLLQARGFTGTQATISRDIKQLHLVKAPTGQGRYRYAVSDHGSKIHVADKLQTIFRESIVNVDYAQNLVVIHTMSGLANGAAAFCISGSGSTCLAVADGENAETIAEGIRKKLADSPYGWRVLHLNPDRCGAQVEELR